MRAVDDVDGRRLDPRVRLEVRAEQAAVEGPAVLRVSRRVDTDPPPAAADERFEGGLLPWGEDVPGGVEEDDRVEAAEALAGERRGVLGHRHREAVRPAEAPDRGDAGRDRVVPEAQGP